MRRCLITLLLGVTLVVAAPAGAATYKVFAGEQALPPQGVPEFATLNQFFPASIRIHKGDKVTFISQGFHTATYLGRLGREDVAPLIPEPSGATNALAPSDAAGNPFYFATLPQFIFNNRAFGPVGSNVIAGKNLHNAGVLGAEGTTFTFPKTGTFMFVCLIHPGMEIPVVVKPTGATIAGPGPVSRAANRQIANAWKVAKQLAEAKGLAGTANTVEVGPSRNGASGETTLHAFAPQSISVPEGSTVEFVAGTESEIHNIVFGPDDWWEEFDKETAPPDGFTADPVWIYGTDAVAGAPARLAGLLGAATADFTYDGTNHQNGVLGTPIISTAEGGPLGVPFARTTSVTFPKAGTYRFFCLIHGTFMSGDVVVTPAGA